MLLLTTSIIPVNSLLTIATSLATVLEDTQPPARAAQPGRLCNAAADACSAAEALTQRVSQATTAKHNPAPSPGDHHSTTIANQPCTCTDATVLCNLWCSLQTVPCCLHFSPWPLTRQRSQPLAPPNHTAAQTHHQPLQHHMMQQPQSVTGLYPLLGRAFSISAATPACCILYSRRSTSWKEGRAAGSCAQQAATRSLTGAGQ